MLLCFFFQAEDGIRDADVTGVQTCALPISGDGGDEQFMGYGMYTWADRLTTLKTMRWFLKKGLAASSNINKQRASHYFDFNKDEHLPSHIFSVDQGLYNSKQLKHYFRFQ